MLTSQQAKVLRFIDSYVRANEGVSPTYDEIKDHLGIASKSGVNRIVTALKVRGFLRHGQNLSRNLEVLRLPPSAGPATPTGERKRMGIGAISQHIAAQPWCSADAETVRAAIAELTA